MTYITKRCGKCGFTHRASIYGYVHNPIGIPFSRCPKCGELFRERDNREWIQMSPFKKYRSINPRFGVAESIFVGMLLAVLTLYLVGVLLMPLRPVLNQLGALTGTVLIAVRRIIRALLLLIAVVFFPSLAHYLFTCLHVGSKAFRQSYCDSILRTQNPEYRELLSKQGPLYDEGIPNWVLCTKGAKKKILDYLDEHTDSVDVKIPTFVETINNA